MKKVITIQPVSLRGNKNGKLLMIYLLKLDDLRRIITVSGPNKNFREKINIPQRMTKIIKILAQKSGWDLDKPMSQSDFINFDFINLPNMVITNKLL